MIMSTNAILISQIVTSMENSISQNFEPRFAVDFQFKRVHEMMKLSDHSIDENTYSMISTDLKKCLEKRLDLISHLKVYGELFLPHALEKLSIETCFITNKILAESLQGLASLWYLRLEDIITITCIPIEVLSSLTNLQTLDIFGCLLLTSIGGLNTLSTLQELLIRCCPNLTFETSLVVASSNDTVELTSSSRKRKARSSILRYVYLETCMPSDDMLQGLSVKHSSFVDCPTIVNPHVGHMKALTNLKFQDCPNLASLRGLSELNNVEHLDMQGEFEEFKCHSDADKLPKLKSLAISRWSLLEQLVSREGFSSLVSILLVGAQQESFSEEECEVFHYLSSLRDISFYSCKMRSLPNLLGLHSLKLLVIYSCENLSSLPEMPPSVQSISITGCDEEFTRSCNDPNHPNGRKISHIPEKNIHRNKMFHDEVLMLLETIEEKR